MRRRKDGKAMSHTVAVIGATCLGMVIGWLVRYFIRRFDNWAASSLSSVVSIIAGGAVIEFMAADKAVWWFYPKGLFLGFAIYQIIVMWIMRERKDGSITPAPISLPKDDPRG